MKFIFYKLAGKRKVRFSPILLKFLYNEKRNSDGTVHKMSKKDGEMIEQLENILKELKEGKEQTAGAAAVQKGNNLLSARKFIKSELKKRSIKWVLLVIFALIIGAGIGIGSYHHFTSSKDKMETGAFVEQINELSSLATAQAFVKGVIEKEDNEIFGKKIDANLPGTKRKILLIIPGTVTAGVNLEAIQKDDIHIDEKGKKVKITLPHAQFIQEPSIDFDNIQLYSVEGIFRSDVNWEEAYDLAGEAKKLLKKEAKTMGLMEMAEKNAEKTLKEFFAQMGYDATIQFTD